MDIIRYSADALSREIWTLYVNPVGGGPEARIEVLVMSFARQRRPSRRHHTWTTQAVWTRTGMRHDAERFDANVTRLKAAPRLDDEVILNDLCERMDVSWSKKKAPRK